MATWQWYQTIADVEATADEAESLAAEILAWLVETGVVLAELTDCAGAGPGHAPGPRFATAVSEPDPDPAFLTLAINGVSFDTRRTVHHSHETDDVTCPHCGQVVAVQDARGKPTQAWWELSDAIQAWYDGGSGEWPCPGCTRPVGLNEWTWSPPWGFGYLGMTFWNWPPLRDEFVAEVAARLGHRIVRPIGSP